LTQQELNEHRWAEEVLITIMKAKDGQGRAVCLSSDQTRLILTRSIAATYEIDASRKRILGHD
jgi:hypothetical protein